MAETAPAELRFAFGKNWSKFLESLSTERIALARRSLQSTLGRESLVGCSFLDVGSGSGLFSLAARRLGASVRSFDYDAESVRCTAELRRRYAPGDSGWAVEQGSALDRQYLASLGQHDVVYSWGVLHHTGAMWNALENMIPLVKPGGLLFIAIYNDQGRWSRRWHLLKRIYNRLPAVLRGPYTILVMGGRELKSIAISACRLQLGAYVRSWTRYASLSGRGMNRWRDMVDWLGGYPFEVATPEAIFRFYRDRGFTLQEMTTCGGGLGCNEFVFRRLSHHSVP
ncbi:MAG TPA: class I SAM-dependent methyltransferase [Gemmatimonadaceae bacterium]